MIAAEGEIGSQEAGARSARGPARTFRDLLVWQKAHQWVLAACRLPARFPQSETYGLSAQLRRAAMSIPAHIAEGFERTGVADKRRYLNIAQASLEECRYYPILTNDLGDGETAAHSAQQEEASRLLDAYSRAIHIPGC